MKIRGAGGGSQATKSGHAPCKCVRAREYVYVVPVAGRIVAAAGWRPVAPVAPGRKALRWLASCLV